jgi:hypothetical protein
MSVQLVVAQTLRIDFLPPDGRLSKLCGKQVVAFRRGASLQDIPTGAVAIPRGLVDTFGTSYRLGCNPEHLEETVVEIAQERGKKADE